MNNTFILGDLHLKLETKEYLTTLWQQDMVIAYKTNKCECTNTDIVFVGDIYDGKAIIRSEVQNYFIKFLETILPYFNNVIILVGNHDLENVNKTETALNALSKVSNKIQIIDKCTRHGNCVYLPYYHNQKEFLDAIEKSKEKQTDYIFCHQSFNGFQYQNNVICNDGIDFKDDSLKHVFGGHFHVPQNKNNITYIGSCWSQNFGEANQVKRFKILLSSGEILDQLIHSLPKHHQINIKFDSKIDKTIDDFIREYGTITQDSYLKLNIEGDKNIVEQKVKEFKMLNNTSIQVKYTDNKPTILIEENLGYYDMFLKWIQLNNKKLSKNINAQQLNKKAKEYIEKYA